MRFIFFNCLILIFTVTAKCQIIDSIQLKLFFASSNDNFNRNLLKYYDKNSSGKFCFVIKNNRSCNACFLHLNRKKDYRYVLIDLTATTKNGRLASLNEYEDVFEKVFFISRPNISQLIKKGILIDILLDNEKTPFIINVCDKQIDYKFFEQ